MITVIDTNVFVSSFLNLRGNPRKIIGLWKEKRITLCLCEEILLEYVEVLGRLGLEGEPELKEILDLFKRKENLFWVRINGDIDVVKNDPEDNKFLECALLGRAEIIISGDKHLRLLKFYRGISIVSPVEFLEYARISRNMESKNR